MLPSTKRRRQILKQERAITQGAQEVLVGISYQSGIYQLFLSYIIESQLNLQENHKLIFVLRITSTLLFVI
jgi:hypothetical protein